MTDAATVADGTYGDSVDTLITLSGDFLFVFDSTITDSAEVFVRDSFMPTIKEYKKSQ